MSTYTSISETLEKFSMPIPESGCLIWIGTVNIHGYGRINRNGKLHLAHRLAWQEKNGPINKGLCICHKCDIPSCINPEHMFLGTKRENTLDRIKKNRTARGEKVSGARLTPELIKILLDRKKNGESYLSLGREFNISPNAIAHACRGINWTHLDIERIK